MTGESVNRETLKAIIREVLAETRPMPLQDKWTPQQVAARFGIKCTQTVIDWIKAGKVEATKDEFANRWIIPLSEVEYLDSVGGKPLSRRSSQAA